MPLPINIEHLLAANKVESSRIEFKAGWNPDAIYRTVCAFANDFDNIGGGYIVIGVEEENGVAKRPVKGLDNAQLDTILREMIGFNNLIEPTYFPAVSVEQLDGKNIIVMWVMGGASRPYKVPEYVTHKKKIHRYYIRYNSSSIVPKGDLEQELISLSNQTPFDDRGNLQASYADISKILLYDYLTAINSRLARDIELLTIEEILKQMDLLVGSAEKYYIKNVCIMLFCEQPFRFFPYTQVDIVIFPEGKAENPGNLIEVPTIRGPVHFIIKQVLGYLRTNIIKERIVKMPDIAEANRIFNYPFEALEEAVVNALYHRDYQIQEPVEITVEPNKIEIINYGGPHRSIKYQDIKAGKIFKARRYRNRRLGEFLKELDLTEGRSTGIPTIQSALSKNGSPLALFDTDDDRTYFLVEFHCHTNFINSLNLNEFASTHFNNQNTGQVTGQVAGQVAGQVTGQEIDNTTLRLIRIMTNKQMSVKEMMLKLNLAGRDNFRKGYLQPAIEQGYLAMAFPAKPNHPNQKYYLTSKSQELLNTLNNQ